MPSAMHPDEILIKPHVLSQSRLQPRVRHETSPPIDGEPYKTDLLLHRSVNLSRIRINGENGMGTDALRRREDADRAFQNAKEFPVHVVIDVSWICHKRLEVCLSFGHCSRHWPHHHRSVLRSKQLCWRLARKYTLIHILHTACHLQGWIELSEASAGALPWTAEPSNVHHSNDVIMSHDTSKQFWLGWRAWINVACEGSARNFTTGAPH
jgi:hypothetical protein